MFKKKKEWYLCFLNKMNFEDCTLIYTYHRAIFTVPFLCMFLALLIFSTVEERELCHTKRKQKRMKLQATLHIYLHKDTLTLSVKIIFSPVSKIT